METDFKAAEVKLIYKNKVKASERLKIYNSTDVYKLLINNFYDKDTIEYRESFKVILVNQANKVLGVTTISEGGISETIADIRIILQAAILSNASGIILSHNHPSGNLTPSEEDKRLIQRVNEAAIIMRIKLLDHLIITSKGYLSFVDEGLI